MKNLLALALLIICAPALAYTPAPGSNTDVIVNNGGYFFGGPHFTSDSNGNTYVAGTLGVGTTAPSSAFQVIGTSKATNFSGLGTGITGLGTSNLTTVTGTPSSTTFLRGDNTWGTPSGGGSVSLTAGNTGIVVSPSPITGTGTISLGVPSATTLGGVESITAVTHNFLTSISTAGVPAQAQPAFTDISGTCTIAQGCTGATALTQGSVVFAGASGVYTQDNANFFWDATNHFLGIGTSIPANQLTVVGSTSIVSTSANALTVGTTVANPILKVDASTANSVTGLSIVGAASGGATSILATANSGSVASLNLQSVGNSTSVVLHPGGTTGTSTSVMFAYGSSNLYTFTASNIALTPGTSTTAATTRFLYTGAGDTTLTTTVEAPIVYWNLSATRQWATGALALQRDARINCGAIGFVGASTVTKAACLSIDGPPTAGTNATITNAYALDIASGNTALEGNVAIGTSAISGALNVSGTTTITDNTSASIVIGQNGATNPAFSVDDSTASSATGIIVKSAATGGTTTITATDSGSNTGISLLPKGTGTTNLGGTSSGAMMFNVGSGNDFQFKYSNTARFSSAGGGGSWLFSPISATTTTAKLALAFAAGDTNLTAGANAVLVDFEGAGNTRQHATGALPLQTDYRLTGVADSFVGVSTMAEGATLFVQQKSVGTNGTGTMEAGIYIGSSASVGGVPLTGTITNSTGLDVWAATGPTNNYAALFETGNVGIGTNVPTSPLFVVGTATATTFVGNVPVTDLNSGTGATSSTFWRGDGTWASPSGSGTVNSGTSGQFAYYASSGTTLSGNLDPWFSLAAEYRVSECSGTFKPSWCSGSDIGAWINSAEVAIGTQSFGKIVINPGTYTQSTKASTNTYTLVDANNAYINWNSSSGVAFAVSGGNPQGVGSPGWPGAGIENMNLSYVAGYTGGNTNQGIYIGGDPTSTISPTGNYGAGLIFRNVQVAGFDYGINPSGNNTWANTYDHVSLHENNENIYNRPTLDVISAWTIVSNVVTFTTTGNTIAIGETFTPNSFTTGSYLNGVSMTAISGTNTTTVKANFTHANASATEFGLLGFGATNSGEMSHITNSDIFDAVDCGMNINAYYDWAISNTNFDYNVNGGICGQGIFKLSNDYFEQQNGPFMNFTAATILNWVNGGVFLAAGSGTEHGIIYATSNDPTFNNIAVRNVVISGGYTPADFIYTAASSNSQQSVDWKSIVLQTGGTMVQTDAIPTCGTGCTSIAAGSTNDRGSATSSASITSITVNWNGTQNHTPFCAVSSNETTALAAATPSTTALVITTASSITSKVFTWVCQQ